MPIPVEVYDFGEDMALVYEWCTNRVIQNIAKYFPYIHLDDGPMGSFEWQAKKLVELGQCNEETMRIIRDSLEGVPDELARTLEEQITRAVRNIEPELEGAAKAGFLHGGVQPMSQSIRQSFTAYYEQAANKLNLVNTVMIDSTQQAYTGVVSDVVTKIANTQRYLNDATGSVVTGVETINSAMRQAINRMVDNGISGFVDHAGRRWSPEAYVQMDIRTTVANAARQAAFDRCDDFGSDIIQIDSHAGARPLCYPWQGKLISRVDAARDVEDVDGNTAHVYALSETSYGNPAGLFGVNCRHFGTPFIPGFSGLMNKDLIQPKEENDERYALTQEQRYMERQIRDARLKESVAKARGDAEEAAKWHGKVKEMSDKIGDFCEATGLPRRKDREYTPIKATWPGKTGPLPYNVPPYQGNAAGGNANGPAQSGPNGFPKQGATLQMYDEALGWAVENYRYNLEELREGWANVPSQIKAFDEFEKRIPQFEKALKDALQREEFSSRTTSGAIQKILEEGRFKTQIETGQSSGYLDIDKRRRTTQQLFAGGEPIDVADSEYEIYGYLDKAKRAKMYGDSRVVFKKDNLFGRTTVTVGDSLELLETGADPMPTLATDPKIVSYGKVFSESVPNAPQRLQDTIRDFDMIAEHGYMSSGNYVELQFHGGVTLDDIEYIEVPKDAPNADIIAELAAEHEVKIVWR